MPQKCIYKYAVVCRASATNCINRQCFRFVDCCSVCRFFALSTRFLYFFSGIETHVNKLFGIWYWSYGECNCMSLSHESTLAAQSISWMNMRVDMICFGWLACIINAQNISHKISNELLLCKANEKTSLTYNNRKHRT